MDQLETLIFPTETVDFNGQKLEVRGLGLAHITTLVAKHRDVLAELYTKAISGQLEGSAQDIALRMIKDFVPLASMTIAMGLGSSSLEKQATKAAQLPLLIQVELLEKIFRLTLVNEGGLEKLMEIVTGAAAGMARLTSPKA